MYNRVLEIRGLEHGFEAVPVLRNVDLSLQHGEFLVLLGASGCGKTTLLRNIAGLATPRRGRIEISGRVVTDAGRFLVPPEERGVGLVFQDYALFPTLSVRENIEFGVDGPSERLAQLIDSLGLGPLLDRLPSELSGGQQQRVALARALAPGPQMLLLDEPFANVDASLREQLASELKNAVGSDGTSVVLVTHDRREALTLADRVAVLGPRGAAAEVLQCDAAEGVYRRPVSRVVAELIGPASFVDARCETGTAVTEIGSFELASPREGTGLLMIRPDDLRFEPRSDGACRVGECLFESGRYRLQLDTAAGKIRIDSASAVAAGTPGVVSGERPCWLLPTQEVS